MWGTTQLVLNTIETIWQTPATAGRLCKGRSIDSVTWYESIKYLLPINSKYVLNETKEFTIINPRFIASCASMHLIDSVVNLGLNVSKIKHYLIICISSPFVSNHLINSGVSIDSSGRAYCVRPCQRYPLDVILNINVVSLGRRFSSVIVGRQRAFSCFTFAILYVTLFFNAFLYVTRFCRSLSMMHSCIVRMH